jgi:hypothetical protein
VDTSLNNVAALADTDEGDDDDNAGMFELNLYVRGELIV